MSGKAFKEKKEDVRLVSSQTELAADQESHDETDEPDDSSPMATGRAASIEANPVPNLSYARPSAEPHFPDLGERYEVLEKIGSGGMGTIWKVFDRTLDQTLAIKILHPEMLKDSTAVRRFEQEARLATDLTHVNIAAIYGPGTDKIGRPFIIMNYVEGENLAVILAREGKIPPERALDIFHQICAALSHSHMKGVIHRDIKPSNIIISKTPSGADLVHVVDFGIAKSVYGDVQSTQALTKAEDTCGSPIYMSPEQCLGEQVTARSDIYSLGCVLYEMLTGYPPFREKNPVKLILQHLHDKPDFSQVPENLWALVFICLQKDQRARPATIDDLLGYETGQDKNGDFNGSPQSFEWVGLLPTTFLLIFLPAIASHFTDPVNSFFNFSFMWVIFITLWLTLAIANAQTVIRSPIVRTLEQTLFVACLLTPALAIINVLTRNWYEPYTISAAICLFACLVARLRQGDLYGLMFSWRHPSSLIHRAETRLLEILLVGAKLFALVSLVIGIGCLVIASQVWRVAADIVTHGYKWTVWSALLFPILSFVIWFLADLIPANRGLFLLGTVRKSFYKTLRIFAVFSSTIGIAMVALIAIIWSPACTYLLREQLAWTLITPASLKAQQDAIGAPHTALGDLARTWAIKGLLFRADRSPIPVELAEQVLNNKTASSPSNRAVSYMQLAQLTHRTGGWTDMAKYFDKALDELKKPEPHLDIPGASDTLIFSQFQHSRGETAMALARLSLGYKDTIRLQQVITLIDDLKLPLTSRERKELNNLRPIKRLDP